MPISNAMLSLLIGAHLITTLVTHYHKVIGGISMVIAMVLLRKPLGKLLYTYLVQSWRELNQQAVEERQAKGQGEGDFDYRVLVVLGVSAVVVTLMEYFGGRNIYQQLVLKHYPTFMRHEYYKLSQFAYWSFFRLGNYILLPLIAVSLMPGERMRDYGLSLKGIKDHIWIYVALFGIIFPVLVMVSYTPSFQRTYPFYKLVSRSWGDFFIWEMLYGLQFFALEVFFRGFMIHPLKRTMGSYAVFVMAVPYCMIHYNKPLAEVLGAFVAGTILGTLSLKTNSIYCGVLIHVSVAISMDLLSMGQQGLIPGRKRWVG